MKAFILTNIGISISIGGLLLLLSMFVVWAFTLGTGFGVLAFAAVCAMVGAPAQFVYDEYKRFRRD